MVTHGALTVAGLASFIVGALLLFRGAPAPYHVSTWLIASIAVVLGGMWAFGLTKAMQARRQPVAVGPQEIVGQIGEVRSGGLVAVRGELWKVHTREGQALKPGQHVEVEGIDDGLALEVKPLETAPHE